MAAERELEEQLKDAGNKLLVPSSSIDELLSLLDQVEYLLSRVEQSPAKSMQDALAPLTEALAAAELLGHSNVDVKVAVASCISEITRITAPDAPYDDDKMKDVFQLIVSSFENLPDKSSRSYNKRVLILETVAKVRSCVVMLDLECDRLIAEMFKLFLGTIRDYHSDSIFLSMETIMTLVLEESEDVSPEILAPLLASVKKDNQGVLPIAVKLAEKVFQNCAVKLKPYLSQAIKSLDATMNDYSGIIASVCRGDSSVNRHDGNPSSELVVTEDNSAVASTDGAQETQVAEDLKNASKEDDADPEVKLTSPVMLTNGVDGTESKKDAISGKGAPSVNSDEQVSSDQPSADKVVSKLEADALEAEKPSRMESKNTAKKKGRKSNTSTTISEPSDDANEKEAQGCPDQETGKNGRVEALGDSVKEDKSEEDTSPMEDTAENLPSSKPIEAEAVRVTSPSQAEESRPKKSGRTKKKKESLGREDILRNATEAKKESDTKANKVERSSADSANEDKKSADEESSKSGGGGRSDSGKVGPETENKEEEEEDNNVEDVTSSEKKKGTKKRGRGKAVSESERRKYNPKDDAKMINSEKSPAKSAKGEGFQDETLGPNSKRKPGDGKERSKASGSIEYDESLVGRKVKVWWPKDHVFYDGIVKSFDAGKKKHTVLYDDGEMEVLNLKKERLEFIEDSVSYEVQVSEPESPDGAEMQRRKRAKTAPASSAKRTPVSPKGGSPPSGKSKSGVTKSNRKSKDEGNDSKQKEKSSKPAAKSEDNVGSKSVAMKSKENDGTTSKNKSKQESLKSAEKSKHDSPKTVTQSKGKTTQAGGDQSSHGTGKSKHSSLKSKETGDSKENQRDKSSNSSKTPEGGKKKGSESKAQESEGPSKKRRRG